MDWNLRLKPTDALQQWLQQDVDGQERAAEAATSSEQPATWRELRQAATILQAGTVEQRPRSSLLHMAAKDSGLVLGSPPARVKSLELQARLSKLQQQLDKRQYDQMTADVTQQERLAKDKAERGLPSYKQQISFGVHVTVMMATFYAFGHCAAMTVSKNKVHQAMAGLVGMISAMLLETWLYIIRTNFEPHLRGKAPPGRSVTRPQPAVSAAAHQPADKQKAVVQSNGAALLLEQKRTK